MRNCEDPRSIVHGVWWLVSFSLSSGVSVSAEAPARAHVRILQPAKITRQAWKQNEKRKERVLMDEYGRKLRLRIIDYE